MSLLRRWLCLGSDPSSAAGSQEQKDAPVVQPNDVVLAVKEGKQLGGYPPLGLDSAASQYVAVDKDCKDLHYHLPQRASAATSSTTMSSLPPSSSQQPFYHLDSRGMKQMQSSGGQSDGQYSLNHSLATIYVTELASTHYSPASPASAAGCSTGQQAVSLPLPRLSAFQTDSGSASQLLPSVGGVSRQDSGCNSTSTMASISVGGRSTVSTNHVFFSNEAASQYRSAAAGGGSPRGPPRKRHTVGAGLGRPPGRYPAHSTANIGGGGSQHGGADMLSGGAGGFEVREQTCGVAVAGSAPNNGAGGGGEWQGRSDSPRMLANFYSRGKSPSQAPQARMQQQQQLQRQNVHPGSQSAGQQHFGPSEIESARARALCSQNSSLSANEEVAVETLELLVPRHDGEGTMIVRKPAGLSQPHHSAPSSYMVHQQQQQQQQHGRLLLGQLANWQVEQDQPELQQQLHGDRPSRPCVSAPLPAPISLPLPSSPGQMQQHRSARFSNGQVPLLQPVPESGSMLPGGGQPDAQRASAQEGTPYSTADQALLSATPSASSSPATPLPVTPRPSFPSTSTLAQYHNSSNSGTTRIAPTTLARHPPSAPSASAAAAAAVATANATSGVSLYTSFGPGVGHPTAAVTGPRIANTSGFRIPRSASTGVDELANTDILYGVGEEELGVDDDDDDEENYGEAGYAEEGATARRGSAVLGGGGGGIAAIRYRISGDGVSRSSSGHDLRSHVMPSAWASGAGSPLRGGSMHAHMHAGAVFPPTPTLAQQQRQQQRSHYAHVSPHASLNIQQLSTLRLDKISHQVANMTWIGQGGGGAVFQGMWQTARVAVKFIVGSSHDHVSSAALEATVSSLVSHPNVVQTFGFDISRIDESSFEVDHTASVAAGRMNDMLDAVSLFHEEEGNPAKDILGSNYESSFSFRGSNARAAALRSGAHNTSLKTCGSRFTASNFSDGGGGGGRNGNMSPGTSAATNIARLEEETAGEEEDEEEGDHGGGQRINGGNESPTTLQQTQVKQEQQQQLESAEQQQLQQLQQPHVLPQVQVQAQSQLQQALHRLEQSSSGPSDRARSSGGRNSGGGVSGRSSAQETAGGAGSDGAAQLVGRRAAAIVPATSHAVPERPLVLGGKLGRVDSSKRGSSVGQLKVNLLHPISNSSVSSHDTPDTPNVAFLSKAAGLNAVPQAGRSALSALAAAVPLPPSAAAAAEAATVAGARPPAAQQLTVTVGDQALPPRAVRASSFTSQDGFGDPEDAARDGWDLRQVLLFLKAEPGMYLTHIILEYCDRGSLLQAIQRGIFSANVSSSADNRFGSRIIERAILRTARDIARGMHHLHASGIIHGDLKPGNVLLQGCRSDRRGFTAKIADFGLAKMAPQGSDQVLKHQWSTVTHMSPEVVQGRWMQASDVWSFGIILWQLTTSEVMPYRNLTVPQILAGVATGRLSPQWPDTASPGLVKLGKACLAMEPSRRPSFEVVIKVLTRIEQQMRNRLRESAAAATAAGARAASGAAAAAAAARRSKEAGRSESGAIRPASAGQVPPFVNARRDRQT